MTQSPEDQEPPDFLAVDDAPNDDDEDDTLDDFGEPPLPTHDIEPFGRTRH